MAFRPERTLAERLEPPASTLASGSKKDDVALPQSSGDADLLPLSGGYGGGGDDQQGGGDELPPVGGDFPDPDDSNSGSDDQDSEESEEESGTEAEIIEPTSLQVVELEKEVSRLSKLCQSLFLTIQNGFQNSGTEGVFPIPSDRMELKDFLKNLNMTAGVAMSKQKALIYEEGFAVYVRGMETLETKQVLVSPFLSIKRLKIKILTAFHIPKSHIDLFSFKITSGQAQTNYLITTALRDHGIVEKRLNRRHVKTLLEETSSIDLCLAGGLAGGVKKAAMLPRRRCWFQMARSFLKNFGQRISRLK